MMSRCLALLAAVLATACVQDVTDDAESTSAVSLSPADTARVLDLVNYPGTDVATLDVAAGLDSRAAKGIIAHRNGADGVSPSADDAPFADLATLDAVPYVGDVAFAKLASYAAAHPAPASASVEGVLFHGWEAEAVVWGVNHASVYELDVTAALDSRAANNLVAKAPFANVAAMGPVSYVGPSALTALRAHALVWWQAMHAVAPPCDLSFTVIPGDADTNDLNELIDDALTGDFPAAEIVTVQIPSCVLTDPTQRARIAPNLPFMSSGIIHWQIDVTVQRPTASELATGGAQYVSDVGEIATMIDERGWTPTNAREQALLANLPHLVDALTAGPKANPSGYVESIMLTDAEECSESAAVLINATNGHMSIVHFYPRC